MLNLKLLRFSKWLRYCNIDCWISPFVANSTIILWAKLYLVSFRSTVCFYRPISYQVGWAQRVTYLILITAWNLWPAAFLTWTLFGLLLFILYYYIILYILLFLVNIGVGGIGIRHNLTSKLYLHLNCTLDLKTLKCRPKKLELSAWKSI